MSPKEIVAYLNADTEPIMKQYGTKMSTLKPVIGPKKQVEGMRTIEKLKLYFETTAFNFYFDVDRDGHEDVIRLFEAIGAGLYEGYTSEYAIQELEQAPEPKRSNMLALIEKYNLAHLDITPEVVRLGKLYITKGIIPVSHRLDSLHIAIASVYGLDCVVSYNFKHINRNKTRRLTASVNNGEGYNGVLICTAKEVMNDE